MPDVIEPAGDDEFGGLDWVTLPGGDPQVFKRLHEALTTQLRPVNLLERCWVRDMAVLTSRIDFLRKAMWTMHVAIMAQLASEQQVSGSLGANSVFALETGPGGAEAAKRDQAPLTISAMDQLMGQAFASQLMQYDALSKLELLVMKERDRVVGAFESRRSQQVRDVLDKIKAIELAATIDDETHVLATLDD